MLQRIRMFENLNTNKFFKNRCNILNSPLSSPSFNRACEVCFCHGSSSSSSHSSKSSDFVELRQKTADQHYWFTWCVKSKDLCMLRYFYNILLPNQRQVMSGEWTEAQHIIFSPLQFWQFLYWMGREVSSAIFLFRVTYFSLLPFLTHFSLFQIFQSYFIVENK